MNEVKEFNMFIDMFDQELKNLSQQDKILIMELFYLVLENYKTCIGTKQV